MNEQLSRADAGTIAGRARKLLRLGRITHHQFALIDVLLWSCRAVGKASTRVSYSQLQAAAHQARSTVAAGLVVLEDLGLVQRIRHRVLAVGQNGGRVWKQLANSYRLLVGANSRESASQTDSKIQGNITLAVTLSRGQKAAQEALRRVAEDREAKLAAEWLRTRQQLAFVSRIIP